jgi:hypothetical protein
LRLGEPLADGLLERADGGLRAPTVLVAVLDGLRM